MEKNQKCNHRIEDLEISNWDRNVGNMPRSIEVLCNSCGLRAEYLEVV